MAAVSSGQRLHDLVISWVDYGKQDAEQECLAGAVYFEARGEPLEGQLAVAQVILNRARSGIYPGSICAVVTQPAQFSFIRGGKFPAVNRNDDNWHKAMAVADIAAKALVQEIAGNVLWYHADYVAPSWGLRLTPAAQIGRHIFYQQG
jgi:spore germination cell wall hydrolase CwlJ-like protein